jgi:hypothetical protein
MSMKDSIVSSFLDRASLILDRRNFFKSAGLATLAAGVSGTAAEAADSQGITDEDILNFALNLEYLESEYYLRAATGQGLKSKNTKGIGTQGKVIGGSKVPFEDSNFEKLALEIARDEEAHVSFLQSVLGSAAVAEPEIDLQSSFTHLARLAQFISEEDTFNPFENEIYFLIGAYIFEDVGVTAFRGAAPLLTNKSYLSAATGILGTEAYHAGAVRALMFERSMDYVAQKISAARAKASGADDQGILLNERANIVPVDNNGITYGRSPGQVLNIVYLGGAASKFGFFPAKLNGKIA